LASYETRRAEVHGDITKALNDWAANAPAAEFAARNIARGQMLADARLLAVRELMKKEMPDRLEDIQHVPVILQGPPQLAQSYFRKYTAAQGATNDSAECLYMTVMQATGDGEARTLFAKQDIGDTDEDGAREFIDGWGQPISWIRWPAGVVSDLQPLNLVTQERFDHDPLDQFRRDLPTITGPLIDLYPNDRNFRGTYTDNIRDRLTSGLPPRQTTAFRLVPMIYSRGPDDAPGMLRASVADVAPLDPYFVFDHPDSGKKCQAGEIDPSNPKDAKDNITNHLIEY
jgi:hypothetical protein